MNKKHTIIAVIAILVIGLIIYTHPSKRVIAPPVADDIRVRAPEDVVLAVGEMKTALGEVNITLNKLVNDYRCPIDAECIEGGAINTNITVATGDESETFNYSSDGMPFEFAGYKISIVDSKPDAMLGNVIRSDEYVVTFHIESALTDIVDNPTNPAGGTVPSGDGASGSACEAVGGQWDNANSECLGIEANACQEIGGEFNECASACRNDPYAEVCTMQCVQVCQFK